MRTATVPATLSVANITMCVSRTVALTSYLPLLVPLKEAIIALPCICFVSRSSLQSRHFAGSLTSRTQIQGGSGTDSEEADAATA